MWQNTSINTQLIVDHAINFFNQFGWPIVVLMGGMFIGATLTLVVVAMIKQSAK